MESEERIVILTTPAKGDGVRMQIERTVQTQGKHRDLLMKQLPHMEAAVQMLKDGNADMVAMSAFDWNELDVSGLMIAGFLPRKEPTWVLVGEDKPEYLKQGARVVCDNELLRRQMRRMRPDIELLNVDEMVVQLNEEESFSQLDEDERWPWFEEQRSLGRLEGLIVPRAVHADYRMKSRRHTLGLQRDQSESNRERFIPRLSTDLRSSLRGKDFPKPVSRRWSTPVPSLHTDWNRPCWRVWSHPCAPSLVCMWSNAKFRRF